MLHIPHNTSLLSNTLHTSVLDIIHNTSVLHITHNVSLLRNTHHTSVLDIIHNTSVLHITHNVSLLRNTHHTSVLDIIHNTSVLHITHNTSLLSNTHNTSVLNIAYNTSLFNLYSFKPHTFNILYYSSTEFIRIVLVFKMCLSFPLCFLMEFVNFSIHMLIVLNRKQSFSYFYAKIYPARYFPRQLRITLCGVYFLIIRWKF